MRRASCLAIALLLTQCQSLGGTGATASHDVKAITTSSPPLSPVVLSNVVVGLQGAFGGELPDFIPVAVNAQCKEVKVTPLNQTRLQLTVEQCADWCLSVETLCTHFVHSGKLGVCALIGGSVCTPERVKIGAVSYARSGLSSAKKVSNMLRSIDEAPSDPNWQCVAPQNRDANHTILWRTRCAFATSLSILLTNRSL